MSARQWYIMVKEVELQENVLIVCRVSAFLTIANKFNYMLDCVHLKNPISEPLSEISVQKKFQLITDSW